MIEEPVAPGRFAVLIADAEDAARDALTALVLAARPDAIVRHADNGRELFAAIQEERFSLIFLDMILPFTDVGKLQRVLALLQAQRTTKLVLVSERLMPGWTKVARHLSAYDVLVKPYRSDVVRPLIDACAASLALRSVLIVDPSDRARRIVRRMLDGSQFAMQATEAESGRHAIRESREQDIDLAFVDFSLSDMPALEAACQLIARSGERTTVVMMDSAVERAHDALGVFGISGVILKPFDLLDLDFCLHRSLGLWRPYLTNAVARAREASVARGRQPAEPRSRS